MIIAIEGIDGSGKGTQTRLLRESISDSFDQVELLSFPRYGHSIGAKLVTKYLNGKVNAGLKDVFGPAMFFALDRFEAKHQLLEFSESETKCLLIDRYVASNIAHQSCKELDANVRRKIQRDIYEIEHDDLGIPKPDITFFFDIDAGLAQERVAKKDQRSYTDLTHDLHEADNTHLKNASAAFAEIFSAALYENVETVQLTADISAAEVNREVNSSLIRKLSI